MIRLADVGNARIKLARVASGGVVVLEPAALETGRPDTWPRVLDASGPPIEGTRWAIGSVQPSAAEALRTLVLARGADVVVMYRSAADVPVPHRLDAPDRTGADRALAVIGAMRRLDAGRGAVVVLCGTAVTVERIAPGPVWEGGAIAAGLRPYARALHELTAQLPDLSAAAPGPMPNPWGASTAAAMEAGLRWGLVGACRELVARVGAGLPPGSTTFWAGGDAPWLLPLAGGAGDRLDPTLIFHGLLAASDLER